MTIYDTVARDRLIDEALRQQFDDFMGGRLVERCIEEQRFGKVIHQDVDQYGHPRRLWETKSGRKIVVVTNTTPEGGRHSIYAIEVDPLLRPITPLGVEGKPQIPICHNAVASTFGMYGHEYKTTFES